MRLPLHPFWAFFDVRSDLAQLFPQHADALHSCTDILWQPSSYLAPHDVCQLRAIAVGTDHDLQRSVTMHAAKVEVAFRRHVCNVGCNLPFLAQLPYLCRCLGIIDRGQDHIDAVEIRRFELAVHIVDLLLLDAVGDFVVETVARRYDGDFGVGIEDIHDAPGGDLLFGQLTILCDSERTQH